MLKKNAIRIKRLERPPVWETVRYKIIFAPLLGWYASKMSAFCFGIPLDEIDADWYLTLVPRVFNPSMWLNKRKKFYTLRVPRNRKEETRRRLYRKGFVFDTKIYLWIRGRRFKME